jgi:hypothetical protein
MGEVFQSILANRGEILNKLTATTDFPPDSPQRKTSCCPAASKQQFGVKWARAYQFILLHPIKQ